MTSNYTLQLTGSPSVTLFCLLLGINWHPSIVMGFGFFFLSLFIGDFIDKIYSKRGR